MLIGSSGPDETAAVTAAAAAFTNQTGLKLTVTPASNLTQQLAQGFSAGDPPDLFYLDPGSFQNYAAQGVLESYAHTFSYASDFYPSDAQAFTYKNQLVCAPKDNSPLSLYVNTADLQAAGIASPPTNWTQLEADAKTLTTGGRVGLVMDDSHSEMDEFLYQNGGGVYNKKGTSFDLTQSADVQALTFLKTMMTDGYFKFPSQMSDGWSGDSFGKNHAAMIIVGNWLQGAMTADYPSVQYKGYPIPTGNSGTKATLTFTNCWGIPKSSKNIGGAVEFVKLATSVNQEITFAKAFGPLPSRKSASSAYDAAFPQYSFELTEMGYGFPDIALAHGTQALSAFDSSLQQLQTSDPSTILSTANTNLNQVLQQNQGG
jgi:multiple sugar transport system substrate-binding protein